MPFQWGVLKQVAETIGISRQFLNNILRGRRNAPVSLLEKLVEECRRRGYETCVFDWRFPLESKNPLFKPYQRG